MASTIDSNGFNRQRYQDLREDIAENWTESFPTINTGKQSVPGRQISIQTALVDAANAKAEFILNAFNPYGAVGSQLSNLAPLMNKRRLAAVKSQVTETLTADANGATVPSGTIISSASDSTIRFQTTQDVTIAPSSTATVLMESLEAIAIQPPAGDLTVISTPVYGLVSATNLTSASAGRARETDGQLRFRMLATSAAAVGTPEGIFTAISEVDSVTYVNIQENFTDVTNANGLPPHSVMPIVEGGDVTQVAQAILGSVAAGINLASPSDVPGATFVTATITNPANQQPKTIYFVRPSNVLVNIALNITANSNLPADWQVQVKNALVEFLSTWDVGRKLFASRLYSAVNAVIDADINSITINGADSITPAVYERVRTTAANISITVA